jgi:hypothetical protein
METHGQLIKRLAKFVDDGAGDWQPTEVPGTFRLATKSGSLKIHLESGDEGEAPDVTFSIYNERGRLVDQFNDRDLTRSLARPSNSESWYQMARRVFDHSRRKAMNAEEIITKMIADLDDDDIPF